MKSVAAQPEEGRVRKRRTGTQTREGLLLDSNDKHLLNSAFDI